MIGTAYETKNIYGMNIPVDKDGFVPEEALQKRYKRFYDGQQMEYDDKRIMAASMGKRIPAMNLARKDYMNTSDEVVPLRCTPGQVARWWQDPSSMDVQDIDTAGAPKVNVPRNMTREQQKDQGHIKVISTPKEEAAVRRTIISTYNTEDLRKFAASRPTVAVCPEPVGRAGAYYPSRTKIELDRYEGMKQGTLAHEGAHHLRATDRARKDIIITKNPDICIEESCTVAEQMARSDSPDYSGYYADVAVYDDKNHVWRRPNRTEVRKMAEEDHQLFTEGRGKGLKGQDALSSVKSHWEDSHISRLRIGGNKMAINAMADTYGNVERVSMAKPRSEKPTVATVKITNATAGRPGVIAAANTRQSTLFSRRKK